MSLINDHWIPVTMSEETEENLEKGLKACYRVHIFTLQTLNDYFLKNLESLRLGDFRIELAHFLKDNKSDLTAQHYSMTKAAEKTFPYFTENKKINKNGKFIAVKPIPVENYRDIQIEARQVWRKYLALNSLITTSHGTVYLEENKWPEIIANQAAEKGIGFDAIPFYWHSVVIRLKAGEPMLRFNLHEPDSKFGIRSKKEREIRVG